MRLSSLALLILALQYSPASAQALSLTDSLVVGFWDYNTEELPLDTSAEGEIRFAAHLTEQHTFDLAMWAKYGDASDSGTIYKGLHMTGTWFIRDTVLGLVTGACTGITEAGRLECDTEKDELGDTDFVNLQVAVLPALGESRIMQPAEGWRIPFLRFEGSKPDMDAPEFWEVPTLSLRRDARAFPASRSPAGLGAPAFDALGRKPSGKAPVRLYQGPFPVPSGAAR
jgi:hypothetical protein